MSKKDELIDGFDLWPWESDSCKPGDKFGKLTVLVTGREQIRPAGGRYQYATYRYYAICQCECGSPPKRVRIDKLTGSKGLTRTCGCVPKNYVHGLSYDPVFKAWSNMMKRCYKTNQQNYERYGGRGITVCERWHDVHNFVEDMAFTYQEGMQVDRIDNNGSYEPSNCRWATRGEQANNKRSNINLTFQGKTMSIAKWAEETGINYGTLWERIQLLGWSADQALTTPALDVHERCKRARKGRWK